MTFDFATFKPHEQVQKTATFDLYNPFSGELLATFEVISAHGSAAKALEVERDKVQAAEGATDEQKEEAHAVYIAALVTDWTGKLTCGGKDLAYSDKNAKILATSSEWMATQILIFANRLSNWGEKAKKN